MNMKKKLISILLCFTMLAGLLPTAALAAEGAEPVYKSAATQIKFYSEDGSKVVKTLKKGQQYEVDGNVVAEYKDGVLTLRNYNGGGIEAKDGSLTMEVYGTNTITSAQNDVIAVTPKNGDNVSGGPVYSLTITGKGSDPSMKFNLTSDNEYFYFRQDCVRIGIESAARRFAAIENLTITVNHPGKARSYFGNLNTLKNCSVTTPNGVSANYMEECTVSSNAAVSAGEIKNCTVNAYCAEANTIKDSQITATWLGRFESSDILAWLSYRTSSAYIGAISAGSDDPLTIDGSTVTLTGTSASPWLEEQPAISDFWYTDNNINIAYNTPGVIIKNNSNVKITNHTYGIISPLRGVLIDNSNVDIEALSVAIGDLGTKALGRGQGVNKYGLHVTGTSQVTLKVNGGEKFEDGGNSGRRYFCLADAALGYVTEALNSPNNTFDLKPGGYVELSTYAFSKKGLPAVEFPAKIEGQTKVVDGAYDNNCVVATKTETNLLRHCYVTNTSEKLYTYTARIEGIKPAMTGEIKYQGAAIYNQQIRASVDGAPTGADVKYQWQINDGTGWKDLSGETYGYLAIGGTAWESHVGQEIRVIAYADNYDGLVIGAEKKIEKRVPTNTPETPSLYYNLTTGDKAEVTIQNYDNKYEYIYTTSAKSEWPTSGTAGVTTVDSNKFTVDQDTNPKTIYVYARFAETTSAEAGSKFAGSSVLIPAKEGSTNYARDMIYPEYGTKTPTIYLKKNSSVTVQYQISPNNATDGLPQWKTSYAATNGTSASVTVSNDTTDKTLTITAGNTAGTVDVEAYKTTAYTDRWQYGSDHSADGRKITVMIYDPADLAKAPFIKTNLGTVNLYEGDTYDVKMSDLLALDFVPAGVNKNGYTLAAKITTYFWRYR